MNMKLTAHCLVILAVLVGLYGCGHGDSSEPTPGTFTYIYSKTLRTACVECHVSGGAQNGVNFDFSTQALAYQSFSGSTAQGSSSIGTCGGIKNVNPGSAATSYLLGVINAAYHTNNFAGVGGCTPYAGHLSDQHLTSAEQDSIVTWITNGALNN